MRLAAAVMIDHPLLLAPPLVPDCTDIPCWVTNPVAPIESCYQKANGDIRRMFSLYGGRPDLSDGGTENAAAQCMLAASITGRLASHGGTRRPMPAIMPLRGAPPGDPRYAGPQAHASGKRSTWRTRGVF